MMQCNIRSRKKVHSKSDGAFHRPDGEATAGAVLLFHGNTMNFYVGAPVSLSTGAAMTS
jgi:hypothetical protein